MTNEEVTLENAKLFDILCLERNMSCFDTRIEMQYYGEHSICDCWRCLLLNYDTAIDEVPSTGRMQKTT